MWLVLTAVVVCIGLVWFYRLKTTRQRSRPKNGEVYICPNCGHQHCDCYKHSRNP